jgi:hypothetical protein
MMDTLARDIFDALNAPFMHQLDLVDEIVRRLREARVSDISIRAMLVEQKPVLGPPPGWDGKRRVGKAPELAMGYSVDLAGPDQDRTGLVIMTMEEGDTAPRVLDITDDPAAIEAAIESILGPGADERARRERLARGTTL